MENDLVLWSPTSEECKASSLYSFISFITSKYNIQFDNYHSFYDWTIANDTIFWQEFLEYAHINLHKKADCVLKESSSFKNNRWFYNAKLNFAENLLESNYIKSRLDLDGDYDVLIALDEQGNERKLKYSKLKEEVYALANYFKSIGVVPGDRVAGLLPNVAESVVAMLATTACGAIWTSCSPDFGKAGILERFSQVEPKVLLLTNGYYYKNKYFDCISKNKEVIFGLSKNLKYVVNISDSNNIPSSDLELIQVFYSDVLSSYKTSTIDYYSCDFNDPVYIMYSSGTTGSPKCIVHGVGGILLEHYKEHLLHNNLNFADNFLYFTTTSWMMWHWLVSAIGVGSTIILYDGAPNYPNSLAMFDLIDKYNVTVFGASAKYYSSLEKDNLIPKESHNLGSLRMLLSTGSPLLDEQFDYVYKSIKSQLALCSISGGTDIIGCFALGNPLLPVLKGELQCRSLGLAVKFFNDDGQEVIDQKGELVCCKPFPSMPISFWRDISGEKYQSAYFNKFDNVWAHGDYGKLSKHNGVVIYGRSDAVLNPGGVRIGTAEIYAELEKIPEVIEGLAVGQLHHNDERIVLFVVLAEDITLDASLKNKIKSLIKSGTSPRHVPELIIQVPELPRTTSGKLVELAVKNIISGKEVKNVNALANPKSLEYFANLSELS